MESEKEGPVVKKKAKREGENCGQRPRELLLFLVAASRLVWSEDMGKMGNPCDARCPGSCSLPDACTRLYCTYPVNC